MNLDQVYLEMTRNCTLYCEHCLRGEKEIKNITYETLNNIFKDIININCLVLGGGEPLLAVNELEYMINLIKDYNVNINEIRIVTNGTVLSQRIIRILENLSNLANLFIGVSSDVFHKLEIKRLGLEDKRDKNLEILKNKFNATLYGEDNTHVTLLEYEGRARFLTRERLDEIYTISKYKYLLSSEINHSFREYTKKYWNNNTNILPLTIDVYGNIVSHALSYENEDKEASITNININKMNLYDSIMAYSKYMASFFNNDELTTDIDTVLKKA